MTPLTIELPPDTVDAIADGCARSRQPLDLVAQKELTVDGRVVVEQCLRDRVLRRQSFDDELRCAKTRGL